MICRAFTVSVFSACLSQALLLPPSLSTDETFLIESLVAQDHDLADKWLVELDYPIIPEGLNLMSDMSPNQLKSILELNFTVQQHKDTDLLMLNELPIYPFMSRGEDIIETLTVPHRIKNEDKTWEYTTLADLGYSVSALPTTQNLGPQEAAIKVDFFKKTDQLFDKIQSIDLQLLTEPSGKLMIQLPQIDVSRPPNINNIDPNEKCTSFLCKAEMKLSNVFKKVKGTLKPCHKPAQHHEYHGHRNSTPHPHKSQPHHNLEHHHLTHYSHLNGNMSIHVQNKKEGFFYSTILPFLGPEVMAILVGATAALGAMLLGYIAIYIWTFLRHRKLNKYTLIRQSDIEDTEVDMSNEFLLADENSEKIG
ncbi:hypothetical protein OnM2_105010 [Erysiphe neolycopersici]|uniref:DUF7728 domain-containing protein n=1 Tax=Erysiphe neolycopersici TaxID=212602 RepID=A0A420H7M3_9PEZI|nr:hypothetical protein OnM2_105010 [Erysiphe neolycopersici]